MVVYRLQYTNTEQQLETIDIIDNDSVTDSVIAVEGSEVAATPETVNNDEDKFYPVRGRALTIQIISTASVNLNTFCEGTDSRWGVHQYTAQQTIFKGFLVLDDMSEDFQDPPNILTLTAIDGLGTLKDVPLTKPDGTNPKGHYKIIEYISWIFQKTNLQLPIYTVHNIMEEDYEGEPMYNRIYIDAKTFESNEPDISISCYEVLEKIFGHDAFCTQANGIWWIIRPDELDSTSIRIWLYDYLGAYVAFQSATTYTQTIQMAADGMNPIEFTQDGALVSPVRAYKKVILTFNLEPPKEIICNMDFIRGTPIDTVLPTLTFTIECWTLKRGVGASTEAPNAEALIIKKYKDFGHETERYALITPQAVSGGQANYIESEALPLDIKDKFTFSVDYSAESDNNTAGSTTISLAVIILRGDDSSYWVLGDTPVPEWKLSNVNFTVNLDLYVWTFNASTQDLTEWLTFSIEAPPLPVAGDLYIWLFGANQLATAADTFAIRFTNLQFTYNPYIHGSYQTYRAQSHTVTHGEDMKAVRDEIVYLSDSPKKIFRGALKKFVAGKYILAERFYNGAVILGSPTVDDLKPFGWHQVQAVWNQYNRTMRNFEFTAQGLRTDTNRVPDMIHKYFIGDSSDHSDNKQFMLLHMSQDHVLCEWKGFLSEIFDSTIPKSYTNAHEFKYITER